VSAESRRTQTHVAVGLAVPFIAGAIAGHVAGTVVVVIVASVATAIALLDANYGRAKRNEKKEEDENATKDE
jgi:hypothetical protein